MKIETTPNEAQLIIAALAREANRLYRVAHRRTDPEKIAQIERWGATALGLKQRIIAQLQQEPA